MSLSLVRLMAWLVGHRSDEELVSRPRDEPADHECRIRPPPRRRAHDGRGARRHVVSQKDEPKTLRQRLEAHRTNPSGAELSSGGVSVDQLIAQSLRGQTPLPSLELSTEPVVSGVDSNVGFTRLYRGHISWESANRPVARETNPRLVWERLCGGGGPADPRP